MRLPIVELVAASGARARAVDEILHEAAAISTDTRTLGPGDVFVALRGERFDGHAFAREALARGAAAVVISDPGSVPDDAPALLVDDTLRAYAAFGGLARRKLDARVVAVTGSAGKTTTKDLAAQLLAAAGLGPVAATLANENNEIGVPKLFLGLNDDVRAVVVELGARHYGEIAPLVEIARPDVAVLTNVGEAHLEIMGSPERLAETKFGIFASGAQPLLNLDDSASVARAPCLDPAPAWFGAREQLGEVPPSTHTFVVVGRRKLFVCERSAARAFSIDCRLPGDHNLANLAAAIGSALLCGAPRAALLEAIPSLTLPQGRYERRRAGEFDVIYDAYNASPSGMLATLRSFSREPASRRIAVLGSMAELGPQSPAMHEGVGAAAAASGLDALLVGGEFGDALARGALGAGFPPERLTQFAENACAIDWLRANARGGDVILLKASRRYHLEEVLEGLRAAHA